MRPIHKNTKSKASLKERLIYKVSLASLFNLTPDEFENDYGGDLLAYSFVSECAGDWLGKFHNKLAEAIGKDYLPVYRMADGEYQFLVGLKIDFHSQAIFRHVLSFMFRKTIEILNGPSIKTSWGETYSHTEIIELRKKYLIDLEELTRKGIICALLYENPKKAYMHYNKSIFAFFDKKRIELNENNLFPFHFPLLALSDYKWNELFFGTKVLIITGNIENRKNIFEENLKDLGVQKVGFYEISANSSLKDKIDKKNITDQGDFNIALVGAGIGSLNILTQLSWFKGPVIDVGGFISVLQDKNYRYHGGAVKYPIF